MAHRIAALATVVLFFGGLSYVAHKWPGHLLLFGPMVVGSAFVLTQGND